MAPVLVDLATVGAAEAGKRVEDAEESVPELVWCLLSLLELVVWFEATMVVDEAVDLG